MSFARVRTKLLLIALATIASACTTYGTGRLADLPLSSEPLTGKFVWHDLVTDDVARARRFYGDLFGWSFEDTTHPNGGAYTVITLGDRYVGGMVQLGDPEGADYSRWLGYLSVTDVDTAVGFTEREGGRAVVGPLDLRGVGRAAAIQDPQRAVVGLLRSEHGDPDDSLAPGPGLVVWNELLAADDAAAADFYAALGGSTHSEDVRERGIYHLLESQGRARAGVMQRPNDDIEPLWITHFAVTDVEAAAHEAGRLGGTVLLGPDPELRNGQLAVIEDPNGAILALHQWNE